MKETLAFYQFQNSLLRGIHSFFAGENFLEIPSPPIVANPGYETHIHPFQIKSKKEDQELPLYLNTSPEFFLKSRLAEIKKDIYSLGFAFRDEPSSPEHRKQFLMLEWYRYNQSYEKILEDVISLFQKLSKNPISFETLTIEEIFVEYCGFNIFHYLEKNSLYDYIKNNLKDIPLPSSNACEWDDLFFLVFLNLIEPKLEKMNGLILTEYPAPLRALSQLHPQRNDRCLRFEVFYRGVEIGNGYQELNDLKKQKKLFELDNERKQKIYNYQLDPPEVLYQALEKGIGNSSGIAIGFNRLLKVFSDFEDIFHY